MFVLASNAAIVGPGVIYVVEVVQVQWMKVAVAVSLLRIGISALQAQILTVWGFDLSFEVPLLDPATPAPVIITHSFHSALHYPVPVRIHSPAPP